MHRETLALRRQVLGDKHPSALTSMSNLAGTLRSQEKHDEAETLPVRYLNTIEHSTAVSWISLGWPPEKVFVKGC